MANTTLSYKSVQWILLLFVAVVVSATSYCQQQDSIENKWKEFNSKLETDTKNGRDWLDSIDNLVMKMPGTENLKEKLATYKKIVWSSNEEKWRRQQYWWFLTNNARMRSEYGLLIFYLEMRQQELGKEKGGRPVTYEKISLFSLAHSPHKTVKEYQSLSKYIETLPQQIDTGTKGSEAYTILGVMQNVIKGYSLLGDTTNIAKLVNDADAIYNAVLHRKEEKTYAEVLNICNQINIFIKYFSDVFLGKMDVAENRIKNLLAINSNKDTSGTELLTSGLRYEILEETTLFYIKAKMPDSASHYLELTRQQLALFGNPIEYKIKLLVFDASISEQQKQYQKGYQKMKEAYALTDSFIGSRQIEIADNMYAQAESAFTQEQLVGITQEKNKITFWAFSIGIVLLIIIATLYSIMKAKGRKAKAQLESLDNATQLQVAELEEHNRMMVLAEKKKLGMELHDDLAGTLAAIKMQLATEALHTTDNSLQTKLQAIGNQVGLAYENTRNKSHEWFRAANEGSESAFSERIHAITEKVLPDDVYQKEITIDDYALRKIELPVKVQLLRIIQESVANILKHAKAHKVAILIYEELNGLVLKISDNGRGFDAQLQYKGRGIGMLSIKARVAELKGSIEIVSGKNGTEITVVIPT